MTQSLTPQEALVARVERTLMADEGVTAVVVGLADIPPPEVPRVADVSNAQRVVLDSSRNVGTAIGYSFIAPPSVGERQAIGTVLQSKHGCALVNWFDSDRNKV